MRHHPRGRVLAPVLVLSAAIGLTGCDVVVSGIDGGREESTAQWTRTYDLKDAAALEVFNSNGRIEAEGTDGTTYDVKVTITAHAGTVEAAKQLAADITIHEERADGKIRLETRYPTGIRRSGAKVVYVLRVPKSAALGLETTNGSVRVNELAGAVRLSTTNGSVTATALSGDLRASTTNGGIEVSLSGVAAGGVELETTNGSVKLALPTSAKASVTARCVNGHVKAAELPLETTTSSAKRLEGVMNGGGPAIRLSTVNGSIRIGPA